MSRKITEKFTQQAKKVLATAVKEAKELGSSLVDTEHVLLAILADDSSVAYKVLTSFQVDSDRIRESVIASTDTVERSTSPKKSLREEGFSESCQEALSAAALQAYLWGSPYVGTEHILCGLAKTPSGLAFHILRSWGITYETLKGRVEGYTHSPPARELAKEPSTPLLNTYSRDLTGLAASGRLDPVIKRETEIARLLGVLSRRIKNNPVLLGDAGVGKTAIVEGLAQRIVDRDLPQKFFNTRLVSLDINAIVAGTRFRGDFEERLLGIIDEIREAGNIIVFIDEIHTIIGAGGAGGALDAANILKPALARGELRCIGATTVEEYSQFIEEDAALERRFQPIYIEEPDLETTISILEGLKERYESYHGVKIKKTAITAAAKLADRYLVDRHLPDSAIDVLDEAASQKSVVEGSLSKAALKISDEIEKLRKEKERLVREGEWEEALTVREQEDTNQESLEGLLNKQAGGKVSVDEKDVTNVVSMMTRIPITEITLDEAKRLLNLEKELGKKVIGQSHVLSQVAAVLRRNRVGLRDHNRPAGSFIFLGTSGVGKTLVAQTLAEILFNDPEALVRLDMSEFSESHTVARLVGAPPGYVGYEEGGELTERLKQRPFSVILLDEIEKAHPEVFNILLQVLDNGQLSDSRGRTINFRNSLIIMTSNVGSHLIRKEGDIGFVRGAASPRALEERYHNISEKLMEQLRKNFRVEFLNRIDSIIVFRPLNRRVVKKIAKLLVKEVAKRLKEEHKLKLAVEESVYGTLIEKGFSEEFGARELRRVVTELIENPLSEKILFGRFQKGQSVKVIAHAKQIILR